MVDEEQKQQTAAAKNIIFSRMNVRQTSFKFIVKHHGSHTSYILQKKTAGETLNLCVKY